MTEVYVHFIDSMLRRICQNSGWSCIAIIYWL